MITQSTFVHCDRCGCKEELQSPTRLKRGWGRLSVEPDSKLDQEKRTPRDLCPSCYLATTIWIKVKQTASS